MRRKESHVQRFSLHGIGRNWVEHTVTLNGSQASVQHRLQVAYLILFPLLRTEYREAATQRGNLKLKESNNCRKIKTHKVQKLKISR